MNIEQRDRSLFVDHARVTVRGGAGGNGAMTFRREKFVAMGGPDGGNGGRGGDVVLLADPQKKSLLDLTYKPHFYAAEGEPGSGSNKIGRSAEDSSRARAGWHAHLQTREAAGGFKNAE